MNGKNLYGWNGIKFFKGKAEISVWAPEKESVKLLLNNSHKIPLSKNKFGYWQGISEEVVEGTLYKILVDDNLSYPDPASLSQPEGVHGYSQAIDLNNFLWTDKDWKNPDFKEYIIYELHTGTFSEKGNFEGIISKLNYLCDLGINAIEIMPVVQFPGGRNWGYDGVFPFAVSTEYGGAKSLQELVNACHKNGIAVILDVVYNHLGPEGNYLASIAPFFTDKYQTPWGQAVNFDDAWSDGVRNYFVQNAMMWLELFHIDALRLDAVHAIKDLGTEHILLNIKKAKDLLEEEKGKKFHLIVELDLNDPKFLDPEEKGGYEMDAQWSDEFHHALRVAAGHERNGYFSDFTGVKDLAKAYTDAYVYDGQFSEHRKRKFGKKTNANGHQFVVFSQNHDQVGNRMLGERTSMLLNFEMQKLLAGAVFISPFIPMMFMGEEWSASTPFQYFVSHTDPELISGVRNGRRKEFSAFHLDGEAPDPVSEIVFLNSKLKWNEMFVNPHQSMLLYYKEWINLVKNHPVLKIKDRQNTSVNYDEKKQLITLERMAAGSSVIAYMNFSSQPEPVNIFKNHKMKKIIDSSSGQWLGNGEIPEVLKENFNSTITLAPASIVVFENVQHAVK